jgi:hypothetical protein
MLSCDICCDATSHSLHLIIYLATLLYFLLQIDFKMSLSSSVKNVFGILMRIMLNVSVEGELPDLMHPSFGDVIVIFMSSYP